MDDINHTIEELRAAQLSHEEATALNDWLQETRSDPMDSNRTLWAKQQMLIRRNYCKALGSRASITPKDWLETNARFITMSHRQVGQERDF